MCKIKLLDGKEKLLFASESIPKPQIKRIKALANFLFNNPNFLELTSEIFLHCYDETTYNEECGEILQRNEKFYSDKEFAEFKKKIQEMYEKSKEIDNDRGRVMEILCSLGVNNKYNSLSGVKLQYHCIVETQFKSKSFSTAPKNLDVCCKTLKAGDYIESKRGIQGMDKKADAKMKVIGKLNSSIKKINNHKNWNHQVYVFVLTSDDGTKMKYYQMKWPKVEFLGVEGFIKQYC